MKNFKRFIMVGAMVLTVSAASVTVFAASSYDTPAEALAGLTGQSVEEGNAVRYETGKNYGAMANDAGKLEEFKAEMLQIKKTALADRVAATSITQERADEIIAAFEKNQTYCDGTGSQRSGQRIVAGFGGMKGGGQGARGFGQGGGFSQVQ